MNDKKINPGRRSAMMVMATIPVLSLTEAIADDKGLVAETDPLAIQLGYRADATKVDTSKFEKRRGNEGANQTCRSCQFYGAPDQSSAPCVVFGGKSVSGAGWCNSWFKRV